MARAVQGEMIGMQAAVINAQAAANSLSTRSPADFADLGPNIMADVAATNRYGAGGPAGASGSIAYSAPGVPFGPWLNRGPGDRVPVGPCPISKPVQLVPLQMSVSQVRQPTLTTAQPLDTSPAPCSRPRTGNICMDIARALVGSTEVSADVLWACTQKGYSQAGVHAAPAPCVPNQMIQVSAAELAAVPPYQSACDPAVDLNCRPGGGLSGLRRRGMGDAYPMQGAYPVSCSPAAAATGAVTISPGWWLALIGLGLLLAAGGSAGRAR